MITDGVRTTSTAALRRTVAALILLALLPLSGCGPSDPSGLDEYETDHRPSTVDADEYETDHRTITVDAGEEFTLSVPANPALGQRWFIADPRPDADVLRYDGKREDIEPGDKDLVGSGDGTQYFDFTALASGKATVKLLHCPLARCGSAADAETTAVPVPTASTTDKPAENPEYFLYEITVR
ncbi:protease inhibitor I42 family protein [Streptomyces sp. NPDC002888]|uniref:protease inhibitor I42 family protein n=1 Tax=Streptomyces sp. NPDC002888 TaxID=3364668 RepID=UPI003699E372